MRRVYWVRQPCIVCAGSNELDAEHFLLRVSFETAEHVCAGSQPSIFMLGVTAVHFMRRAYWVRQPNIFCAGSRFEKAEHFMCRVTAEHFVQGDSRTFYAQGHSRAFCSG